MILSTTPNLEGYKIEKYLGVVTGETIIGANMFKDLFASVRDIVGGRSGAYEKVLAQGKDTALREMEERASEWGANAIVGHLYRTFGDIFLVAFFHKNTM